jgi:hypothetical protein
MLRQIRCQKFLTKNKTHWFRSHRTALIPLQWTFLLFPKLNVSWNGCQFESLDDVQEKPIVLLTNISENCAWIAEVNGKTFWNHLILKGAVWRGLSCIKFIYLHIAFYLISLRTFWTDLISVIF